MSSSPAPPFVEKTYRIVEFESDDIVSWWRQESTGEDSFVIKRVDLFQEQVLPRFFNHRNYSSFLRQLNNYGELRRVGSGIGLSCRPGESWKVEKLTPHFPFHVGENTNNEQILNGSRSQPSLSQQGNIFSSSVPSRR